MVATRHKLQIGQSLLTCSANVFHIVTERTQGIDRHAGDVLIHENSHPSRVHGLKGRDLLLG